MPEWLWAAVAFVGLLLVGAVVWMARFVPVPPPPTEVDPVYTEAVRREREEIEQYEAELAAARQELDTVMSTPDPNERARRLTELFGGSW